MTNLRGFIIGTAGHVDHGKSTLVLKLTGVDPDRLPEEKQRQMTIELGFAPLELPSGRRCGVVDVPGHEKLVRQMLMGAQGFDLVLFTIACDEGPKRQTFEHLSILDIIGIKIGIIVLTKCDNPHDELQLKKQVDDLVKGTILEKSPQIKVSAYTGKGMQELKKMIDELLDTATPRPLDMPAFYPIDRVFTVKGFGVVTTGTLWQGQVKKGEELEIFPSRIIGKLRGIEYFDKQIDIGDAGNRLAINFQNIEKDDVERGMIATTPNRFDPMLEFDAKVRLLVKVKRRTRLKLHFAATEQEVDFSDIGNGFARIRLADPLPICRDSRFILRSIAPPDTIGGGIVVDVFYLGKLNAAETLDRLMKIGNSSDEYYLETLLFESGLNGIPIQKLRSFINWSDSRFDKFLYSQICLKLGGVLFSRKIINEWSSNLHYLLLKFFKENTTRTIIKRAEARSKLLPDVKEEVFAEILQNAIKPPLSQIGQEIKLGNKKNDCSPLEKEIEMFFLENLFSPPKLWEIRENEKYKSSKRELEEVISKLISERIILKAQDDVFFHKKAIAEGFIIAKSLIDKNGNMTLAAFRDRVITTRRPAQALLELLDALGLTRRFGEVRILGPKGLDSIG